MFLYCLGQVKRRLRESQRGEEGKSLSEGIESSCSRPCRSTGSPYDGLPASLSCTSLRWWQSKSTSLTFLFLVAFLKLVRRISPSSGPAWGVACLTPRWHGTRKLWGRQWNNSSVLNSWNGGRELGHADGKRLQRCRFLIEPRMGLTQKGKTRSSMEAFSAKWWTWVAHTARAPL